MRLSVLGIRPVARSGPLFCLIRAFTVCLIGLVTKAKSTETKSAVSCAFGNGRGCLPVQPSRKAADDTFSGQTSGCDLDIVNGIGLFFHNLGHPVLPPEGDEFDGVGRIVFVSNLRC